MHAGPSVMLCIGTVLLSFGLLHVSVKECINIYTSWYNKSRERYGYKDRTWGQWVNSTYYWKAFVDEEVNPVSHMQTELKQLK